MNYDFYTSQSTLPLHHSTTQIIFFPSLLFYQKMRFLSLFTGLTWYDTTDETLYAVKIFTKVPEKYFQIILKIVIVLTL